ncbi:MAG TPA: hypothetical protein VFP96_14075, partial [Candidatus Acidoferrum sp.]|nr:hypothetical protein [Candidatus Acidoferrum sp.]
MSADNTTSRSHRALLWFSFPVVAIVAVAAFTIGTSRMKSAAPVVDRSALQIETVRRGSLVRHVSGL